MGKRYYCDYCDKTMVASPSIIRTHIKGVVHQKLVKEHYQLYKDPAAILEEESHKKACVKFAEGECKFGGLCKHSHYTFEELHDLNLIVMTRDRAKLAELDRKAEQRLKEWKEAKERRNETTIYDDNGVTHTFPWKYNPKFDNYEDLPPSLKRYKSKDFSKVDITHWG